MEQNSKKSSRPWLLGAMFVWALTSAVAFTAYSSRPQASNSNEVQLVPIDAQKGASGAASIGAAASEIVWEKNFESAMQRARAEKKPLMIDFYTDWCGWCKELDKQVFPDQNVVSESANWVSIKINGEKRPDVATAYGVTGYPTVIFAESGGKPLEVLPGFAPPADFVTTMRAARAKWTPQTG
ncbi:MAG TPA: thioredoxin fold domain-containing protein [Abditibacterium sp.]|jgi:thiol:disulfide interchange protein